jgi:hypothetical protein
MSKKLARDLLPVCEISPRRDNRKIIYRHSDGSFRLCKASGRESDEYDYEDTFHVLEDRSHPLT